MSVLELSGLPAVKYHLRCLLSDKLWFITLIYSLGSSTAERILDLRFSKSSLNLILSAVVFCSHSSRIFCACSAREREILAGESVISSAEGFLESCLRRVRANYSYKSRSSCEEITVGRIVSVASVD